MKISHTITVFCMFFCAYTQAQITVTNTQNTVQLVNNVLIGTGVTVSNITLNGSSTTAQAVSNQIGYFASGMSTFPIGRGVVMSTGDIATLPGSAGQFSSTNTPYLSDPDLVTISNGTINDAVVLEFDFVAIGDSMRFKYLFGSEEYPEFVGGNVNDAFGFFLSGPGISGPYQNGAVNLAIIPNTTTPVSINTVNQNLNTAYYTSNASDIFGISTKLDGYTTVLVAAKGLICGQTYHIKLAIGDGGDSVYDSAVFLEAESFSSNAVNIQAESNLVNNFTDTLMAEGCVSTNLLFIRPAHLTDSSQTFYITFGGTADPDLDFINLQDTIVFPIGVDTMSYVVTPTDDGISEPMEYLDIYGYTITVCGDTIYDSLRLYVVDNYDLTFDMPDTVIAVCVPDNPQVTITNFDGSIGPFQTNWSFGSSANPVNLPNNGFQPDTITYYVNVVDGCGDIFPDSLVLVVDSIVPAFNITPGYNYVANCINDNPVATANMTDSTIGPYQFTWSNGTIGNSNALTNNGLNMDTLLYYVQLTDGCGNTITDSVQLTTNYEVPNFTIAPNDTLYAVCPSTLLNVNLIQNGGVYGPYIHNWSNGDVGLAVQLGNNGVAGDQQWHYVITTNACGMMTMDSVLIINAFVQPEIIFSPNDTLVVDCVPDSARITSSVNNGAQGPFSYSWSNGSNNDTTFFYDNGQNNSSVPFTVTVTDGCGFTSTSNGVLLVRQTLQIDTMLSYPSAACDPTGIVSGFISGQNPPGSSGTVYQWTGPGAGNPNQISASVWTDLSPGWYYFTVSDTVCTVNDSIYVDIQDPPIASGTATPQTGNAPLSVVFTNTSQNCNSYFWDFGNGQTATVGDLGDQFTTYTDTGTYVVMLVSSQGPGCSDTIYFTIIVTMEPPVPPIPPIPPTSVQVPNVFSPNEDGANDLFALNALGARNIQLLIFNRWGNLVFSGEGENPGWDGKVKSGKNANAGVYFYRYTVEGYDGQVLTGIGELTLVR